MKKAIFLEAIIFQIVVLFLYAGFSKLTDYTEFERSIRNQPLSALLQQAIITGVPAIEIGIAGLLCFSRSRLVGLYAFNILMSCFTVYIVCILFRLFPRVPCSCGGVIRSLSWGQHLFLNLYFIVIGIAATAIHLNLRKQQGDPP